MAEPKSGWTIETLKEHFKEILIEKDKNLVTAMSAAKEAVQVAETNAEKWRDNANEWRGAMNDREKKFVSITEFDAYKDATDKALMTEKENRDKLMGRKEGIDWVVALLIAAAGIAGTIIGWILKK